MKKLKNCTKCVLPENFFNITFDQSGVCNYCNQTHEKKEEVDIDLFKQKIRKYHTDNTGKYDCVVCLSGGVDSSFTLIELVKKHGLNPLCYHNDHGFEDPVATKNVEKLCETLGVDLIILRHDFEFMKKIWKYTILSKSVALSGCYFCGNIIFLNSIELAMHYGIKLVVNGYSKGQINMMVDKDYAGSMLRNIMTVASESGDKDFYEQVMNKFEYSDVYRLYDNNTNLSPSNEHITVLPFFAFKDNKTDKEVLRDKCRDIFNWQPIQATYPKNTTNCKIVMLNAYCELIKYGYTMYHSEYSEIIRKGEITREQVLSDLNFDIDMKIVEDLAKEVGIDLDALEFISEIPEMEKKEENDFALSFNF